MNHVLLNVESDYNEIYYRGFIIPTSLGLHLILLVVVRKVNVFRTLRTSKLSLSINSCPGPGFNMSVGIAAEEKW